MKKQQATTPGKMFLPPLRLQKPRSHLLLRPVFSSVYRTCGERRTQRPFIKLELDQCPSHCQLESTLWFIFFLHYAPVHLTLGASRAQSVCFLNVVQLGSDASMKPPQFYALQATTDLQKASEIQDESLRMCSNPLPLSLPALQRRGLQGQRSGGPHRWHRWVFGWGDRASTWRMGPQNPHWAAEESPLGWQKVGVSPSTSDGFIKLLFVRGTMSCNDRVKLEVRCGGFRKI